MSTPKWAYGVTTVPARLDDLLPKTLYSLARSGFDKPRLFIDGEVPEKTWAHLDYEKTFHSPKIRTAGNWTLALWELYIRMPSADRYAIFQDDMVCCRNIRQYLNVCHYPHKGYLNLYTTIENHQLVPSSAPKTRWHPSNQLGKGAVALVFSREAVVTLLQQPFFVERPMDAQRGWRAIDGGVSTAMKKAGWHEYVSNPSLVQHTGYYSAMGNPIHKTADSFPGEDFDARDLLK